MPCWKQIASYKTDYPADSVEWCPFETHQNFFACGTYFLLDDQAASAVQERVGTISLMKMNDKTLELVQNIKGFGVLDMKWCSKIVNNCILLGVVNAVGEVLVYRFVGELLELVSSISMKCEEEGDYMTLAVNWSPNGENICVTDNKGNVAVITLGETRLEIVQKWKAHDLEAWTVSFDWKNCDVLLSGGDDSKLKVWDRRSWSSPTSLSRHDSGVTIVQPIAESVILIGGFDEYLKEFDYRRLKTPINQVKCSGGLWRIKRKEKYILTANIYGGFQIVDHNEFKVAGHYTEHASLAYGADWSVLPGEITKKYWDLSSSSYMLATCSFYDKTLNLSIWDTERDS